MASSRDPLHETVLQLLSHHQSVDGTIAEVSSLRQTCGNQQMFATLSDIGCLPMFKPGHNQTDASGSTSDVYINKLLAMTAGDQSSQDKKGELETVFLVLKQLKHTDKLFTARLKESLSKHPRIPLHVIWTLHTEGIFSFGNYLTLQQGKTHFLETFMSNMHKAREDGEVDTVSGILSELLYLGFSEAKGGNLHKAAAHIVDLFVLDYIDETVKGSESQTGVISLSSVQLDIDALRRAYTHLLIIILSHRPELKVSQAIKEQSRWAYGKISGSLTHVFKQLLLPFEVGEILGQLRQILEQQEVNWQLLLSFVSVTTVCLPESAKLFLEFIDGLLQDGLSSCDIETTIMGMLLARQACFQGPHVFLSYSDWFQRTFSEGSRSLASNRKSFTFLMKFLTDLVPYETAQHIKVHILHPPYVPPKCRQILLDYVTLAKTRLEDLKESLDVPDAESGTSASDKGKQVASEVGSAVQLFETTGKIPTSILEASIFKKPYYIGQFLPALLQPRPLPDVPDSKMKLIAALKRSDKIPTSMYTNYEKSCKREASQLLEGVFVDLDSDDDMELSPFEQFESTLQQFRITVGDKEARKASKHSIPEVLSLLCERVETVLSISSQAGQQPAAVVTMETENVRIDPLRLKVIDAILNTTSQLLQKCYLDNNPSFTWLHKLVQSLSQYRVVIETLYKRIFTLLITQGTKLQNHHVDCIAAILVEIQFLGEKLPQLRSDSETTAGCDEMEKATFTEYVFDMLPVSANRWMGLTLRIATSYLKSVFCVHADVDQSLVLPVVIRKFFYLSTRQNVQLRYQTTTAERRLDDDIVSTMFTSELVQNFICVYPLTVADWVDNELSVSPGDDILTDHERYEYFTWIVYQYFLVKGQGDCFSVASAVCSGILKKDLSHYDSAEGCSRCIGENVTHGSNSRAYLVCLLQELTRMFPQCNMVTNDELPWLPQQLISHVSMAPSEIIKHSVVQQFLRLCLSLPAHLMLSNTLRNLQGQTTPTSTAKFVNELLVPHICEGLYLPSSVSAYLCQGLTQIGETLNIDDILNDFCDRCPVFMISLLVNSRVVEPFIVRALNKDSRLKYAFECVRDRQYYSRKTVDHWQQAAVLFSLTLDPTERSRDSAWKKFIQTSPDVEYQHKVCLNLVQMLLLQLTHVQNFQEIKDQNQLEKLELLLMDVIQWVDRKHLAQILMPDEIEEKTKMCANTRLVKLMNLTLIRYFAKHLGKIDPDKVQNVEFMSGVLRAYRDVVTLFDAKGNQDMSVKDDEMGKMQHFIVALVESISPSVLRQLDQDLLLSCGPVVTDCAIRILSS